MSKQLGLFSVTWARKASLYHPSKKYIIDDRSESARQTAESRARQTKIAISYYVEPEQNIALARNKAIENAQGDFIGLIDDDEFPVVQWLLNLYKALNHYKSDGVCTGAALLRKNRPSGY